MVDEATVDCDDENEEFAGMLATLEDRLEFPFQAKVLGETVEVIGPEQEQSSERRGVAAKVCERGRQSTIALADLEALAKDTETADWLAAYWYWLGK
jgi:hypothetical protein